MPHPGGPPAMPPDPSSSTGHGRAAAVVRMFSRPRCGLCDEARAVVEAVRASAPFEFEEVSIEGDDDLERAYGLRVPVVEVDGEEAFEVSVDPEGLRRLVQRSGPAPR